MAFSATAYSVDSGGGRLRSFLLYGSITLNLVFIGLVVNWMSGMNSAPPYTAWQQEQIIPSLSPADGAVVRNAVQRFQDNKGAMRKPLMDLFDKMLPAMRAEPFDRTVFDSVTMESTTVRSAQEMADHQVFSDEFAALSPEGRKKVAASLEDYVNRLRTAHR